MGKDKKKYDTVRRPFLFASCLLAAQVAMGVPSWREGESLTPTTQSTATAADQKVRKLTGVVYGSDGETLPGANVYLKGDMRYAVIADADGHFTLNVPVGAKTLVVSFVGYKQSEIPITKKRTLFDNFEEQYKYR